MSPTKGLHILSAVLGVAGLAFVAIPWSAMALAIWASTVEQIKPFSADGTSRETVHPTSTPIPDLYDADVLNHRYGIDAADACDNLSNDYIHAETNDVLKWNEATSDLFGRKFDKYQAVVSEAGVITLTSDKLAYQTGPRAAGSLMFYCRYDTQARKVLGYRIGP